MINLTRDIDSLMCAFKSMGSGLSFEKICEYDDEQKKEYKELLDIFKTTNSSDSSSDEKGIALENIASFLLKTGNIFKVYRNIKTSTNELDQFAKCNNNTNILFNIGIIDCRLKDFIGECKNYNSKVGVTHIGKIYSLLSTTGLKLCILFSYHGVTGTDWKDGMGLIKKIYMTKEKPEEKYCIIDFNINDFENVNNDGNFLQIIHDKIEALRLDTDYSELISKHEAENQI